MSKNNKTNKKFTLVLSGILLVGLSYGGYKYYHSLAHETTDDAQIQKNMTPIIPRVTGYVTKVYVNDNDYVKKGDTLFTIDNRDYQVKVEEAKAALAAAENSFEVSKADVGSAVASVAVSNANVQSATSNIESAKIRLWRANRDFERYENLYKNKSITKQQYEQALAAKQEAENQLKMLKQQEAATAYQKNAMISRSTVSSKQTQVANANIKRAKAVLDAALLNLDYTAITAS